MPYGLPSPLCFVVLRADWRLMGFPYIRSRMALHCGPALVGNLGAPERLNYTCIGAGHGCTRCGMAVGRLTLELVRGESASTLGDNVNLTSRLQGLNKAYGTNILISRDVEHVVKDKFLIRPLDRVAVKGKSKVRHHFNPSRAGQALCSYR